MRYHVLHKLGLDNLNISNSEHQSKHVMLRKKQNTTEYKIISKEE